MDIRFEKREHLQEKPDQKNLGFGKHFTDYMFVQLPVYLDSIVIV